jgi:hypothetical protein
MGKTKRRLTNEEMVWIKETMERAPMGNKPTMRWFAKQLGVNTPSVLKYLGGWKGIKRQIPAKQKIKDSSRNFKTPQTIEPYTFTNDKIESMKESK